MRRYGMLVGLAVLATVFSLLFTPADKAAAGPRNPPAPVTVMHLPCSGFSIVSPGQCTVARRLRFATIMLSKQPSIWRLVTSGVKRSR